MVEYKNGISSEQSAQLKNELKLLRETKEIVREKKERKTQAEELGKPKLPMPAFFLFANELRRNFDTKLSASDLSHRWRALSDEERKKYIDEANASLVIFKFVLALSRV